MWYDIWARLFFKFFFFFILLSSPLFIQTKLRFLDLLQALGFSSLLLPACLSSAGKCVALGFAGCSETKVFPGKQLFLVCPQHPGLHSGLAAPGSCGRNCGLWVHILHVLLENWRLSAELCGSTSFPAQPYGLCRRESRLDSLDGALWMVPSMAPELTVLLLASSEGREQTGICYFVSTEDSRKQSFKKS